MEFGATFAPLVGPSVGVARSFRDWMATAEQVCATLDRVGFHFVVFTHSYQYGGMQPLVTMARLAPVTGSLRMPTLAQLEQQRDKAEAAKIAAAERQATLERQIEDLKKEERAKRERTIGKLAFEAGLGEWRDEALLTAFKRLAGDITAETPSSPVEAD